MTSRERAEKIAQWFFQVDDPQQQECLKMIAAQIEEAEREARNEGMLDGYQKHVMASNTIGMQTINAGYKEGFKAARKKAAGIAENVFIKPGHDNYSAKIAKKIREMKL